MEEKTIEIKKFSDAVTNSDYINEAIDMAIMRTMELANELELDISVDEAITIIKNTL